MFYQLKKDNPDKEFHPVINPQVCMDMKKVTLEKIEALFNNLENESEIILDESVMETAKKPLERMLVLAAR